MMIFGKKRSSKGRPRKTRKTEGQQETSLKHWVSCFQYAFFRSVLVLLPAVEFRAGVQQGRKAKGEEERRKEWTGGGKVKVGKSEEDTGEGKER